VKENERKAPILEIEKGETDRLDIKRGFDPTQTGDWCELIKDIVAITNSGGGRLNIGLYDDGKPSGESVHAFISLDPAERAHSRR
jgi:hypothetical protein